jgi:hypothetical protein
VLLALEDGEFAFVRLRPEDSIPEWAVAGPLASITRTAEELSIICAQENVPKGAKSAGPWRSLRVAGQLEFSLVGVMAALCGPLAEAGIPLLTLSTFNTDYIFIRTPEFPRALEVLRSAGHSIRS